MEAYIGKCLDSLLIPEFDAVEVLVVNDGSKDRSSEIAHSYADRYPGSIRVIDKPNGNYGSCINAALPLATGRYIKVLDADDTFDTAAFSSFVRLLPSISDDAVITPNVTIDQSGNILGYFDFRNVDVIINHSYTLSNISENSTLAGQAQMHKLAYRCDIFSHFSYRQTEGISYTDTEWAIIPFSKCKTIRFVDLVLYRYLIGRLGQTMSAAQLRNSIAQFFAVGKCLIDFYNEAHSSASKRFLHVRITQYYKFLYLYMLNVWDSEIAEAMKSHDLYLKTKCEDIYQSINQILLDKICNYKIIEEIRKSDYPHDFKIPLRVRLKISLFSRFNRFHKKLCR